MVDLQYKTIKSVGSVKVCLHVIPAHYFFDFFILTGRHIRENVSRALYGEKWSNMVVGTIVKI